MSAEGQKILAEIQAINKRLTTIEGKIRGIADLLSEGDTPFDDEDYSESEQDLMTPRPIPGELFEDISYPNESRFAVKDGGHETLVPFSQIEAEDKVVAHALGLAVKANDFFQLYRKEDGSIAITLGSGAQELFARDRSRGLV